MMAQTHGVELIGPTQTSGVTLSQDEDKLNIDDFTVDESIEEVTCCPTGHAPMSSKHSKKSGQTRTVMPQSACSQCDYFGERPVRKNGDSYLLKHTAKQRRCAARRREEKTQAFRERYSLRAGIESTNSGLKRRTDLGRLRVRGRRAVFNAIYLKMAGWNILRAAVCAKMHQIVYARARKAVCMLNFILLRIIMAARNIRIGWKKYSCQSWRQIEMLSALGKAA